MPIQQKIPESIAKDGAIGIQRFAIFCKGIINAAEISAKLERLYKSKGIPAYGYIKHKREKIYYCFYGLADYRGIRDLNK